MKDEANKKSREFLWPGTVLILGALSFTIRSYLGIPALSGTWLRSALTRTPFGFSVTGLGPWYDGSLGWPLLIALVVTFMSAVLILSRDQDPRMAYAVFALLAIASIPTWLFPISLIVPIALLGLPIFAVVVIWQACRRGPFSHSLDSRLRAARTVSTFIFVLACLDWTMVVLVGGS